MHKITQFFKDVVWSVFINKVSNWVSWRKPESYVHFYHIGAFIIGTAIFIACSTEILWQIKRFTSHVPFSYFGAHVMLCVLYALYAILAFVAGQPVPEANKWRVMARSFMLSIMAMILAAGTFLAIVY